MSGIRNIKTPLIKISYNKTKTLLAFRSVTSYPVFMQMTMRWEKWRSLLLRKNIKPISKDMFDVGMFWIIQGKA